MTKSSSSSSAQKETMKKSSKRTFNPQHMKNPQDSEKDIENSNDEDVNNWLEAERQLRSELGRDPNHDEIAPRAEQIWREKNIKGEIVK